MKASAPDSRLRLAHAQSIRHAVALVVLATFSVSLLGAVIAVATPRAIVLPALAAATVTVATAARAIWARRRAHGAPSPLTSAASLAGFAVIGGLFTSQFGGLGGIGLGVLIASWAPAAWLAPRHPVALSMGLSAQAAIFVAVATTVGSAHPITLSQLALMGAGIVVVAGGGLDFTRRTDDDASAWQKLDAAQRDLELQRAELETKSADLNRAAREQLDEALVQAKTTEQLDRLLAERVAGRSRRLAEQVDHRNAVPRVTLGPGVACGRALVIGRMSPAPYANCYLAAEKSAPTKRLIATLLASPGSSAVLDRIERALIGNTPRHPAIAGFVEVVDCDHNHVAVLSEHRPGRLLSHVMARPDLIWSDAVGLGRAIAEALGASHEAAIFHLALDPYRVTLGNIRFGLSIYGVGLIQAWHAGGGSASLLPQIASTPAYRAPECAVDALGTAAADVYALGILLFELVAKLHPLVARVDEDGRDAARALLEIQPELDSTFAELIRAMLSNDDSQRPTMKAVAARLGHLAATHAVPDERLICARLNGSSATNIRRAAGSR